MALVLKDRVVETSTSSGTGTFTLSGAQTGYQSFAAIGNGNTTYYTIQGKNSDGTLTSEWEVGLGTYNAGTLTRDTVYESSNAGALVSFAVGLKDVFVDLPAEQVGGGSMTYPAVGIANSTGTAWGTSYSTTGTGTVVALATSPTLSSPTIDGANPYVQFNNGSAVALAAGRMWYNGTTGSWNLGMGGGNITQQVGEELFYYGKASAAITDSPLQLVYQTGTVGASGVITFAPTVAGITDGNLILGAATESLALNAFGRITTFGIIHGITTDGAAYGETWADGDTIWYNPVTGNPTNIKPVAPNIKVSVGTIIKAGAGGSGSISIEVSHGSVLGGTDSNVQLTSATNGQILTYDTSNSYWKNTSLTAGTAISVSAATGGTLTVTNTAPDQTVVMTPTAPITITGTYPSFTVGITQSNTSTNGYLSSTDWNTFNNKQPAGAYLTTVTVNTPLSGSGTAGSPIVISQANTTTSGYLSSTDWNTFNNKVSMVYPAAGIPNSTGTAWGTSYTTSGTGTVLALATGASLTTPALSAPTYSSANITAGTNAQGQGAFTVDNGVITSAPNNPSGVTLPSATTGRTITLQNRGANPVNVYPANGGQIDALGANAAISLPVNGWIEFNAGSGTQWYSTANAIVNTSAIQGLGTGVSTALGTAVGSAGAFVTNGGALGTPTSGTVTNLTGTASININGTVGATTPAQGSFTNVITSGDVFNAQPTPTALTATATLTIAQILTNIITVTSATAVSLTLPTGTLTDAGVLAGALPTNGSFDWNIINLGSSTGAVTMVAGTAHTYVGSATVAIATSATFRTRKTATNTFVTYRVN